MQKNKLGQKVSMQKIIISNRPPQPEIYAKTSWLGVEQTKPSHFCLYLKLRWAVWNIEFCLCWDLLQFGWLTLKSCTYKCCKLIYWSFFPFLINEWIMKVTFLPVYQIWPVCYRVTSHGATVSNELFKLYNIFLQYE